jgi:universal stress protein A
MKTAISELESALPPVLCVKKVLVPTDFSDRSKKAFKYALGFARQFGSEIVLAHVLEPELAASGARHALEIPLRAQDKLSVAEKNLQALATSSLPTGNLYVTSSVRTGSTAHEIVEAAKDFDVDLIIIATHGLSGWKSFGMGSITERVARMAPCPVLVVREKEHDFV